MRLISLKLTNFQGIKEFELTPEGRDITVLGNNGTGKTTLFNAFTWLIFGKDSLGQANFEIKNLDEQGNPTHGLNHSVEAALSQGPTPNTISLRKVFSEKFTRKRGSADKEFTGHTIDHFIDNVPVKAGEFASAINGMIDEQLFKLLTNPKFFNEQIHWQKRREILLNVCGDVSDEDVIASDPSLAELPGILNGRKLDDHRKIITGRRAEVNRELSDVPVRISECQNSLVDLPNTDKKHNSSKLTFLRLQLSEKHKEKARIESGGEIAERTKTLREIESKLIDLDNKAKREVEEVEKERRALISALREGISSGEAFVNRLSGELSGSKMKIDGLNERINFLRSEWRRVDSLDYPSSVSICPVCNQALPEHQVRATIERFNESKSENLRMISEEGKSLAKDIDEILGTMKKSEQLIETTVRGIIDAKEKLAAGSQAPATQPENPERAALLEAKESIENVIRNLKENNTSDMEILAEIQALEAEVQSQENIIAQIELNAKTEVRIKDLLSQERKLTAEFEKIEKELHLTNQFIRAKVSMLTDKINSKFKLARWKLFEEAINGGIAECCEVTYNGVPYGTLNGAMRINVGLDVINTLSAHHFVTAPIFIDNAESVVDLIETKAQQIRLVVSGAHKALTIG